MSELPITVTRRRFAGNPSRAPETSESQYEEKKPFSYSSNAFSSFSNLSQSLWNSAQHTFSSASEPNLAPPADNNYNEVTITSPFYSFSIEMPFRDRTAEFRTAAKSYQMRVQGNGYVPREQRNGLVQQSVQFNQLAKRVGRDLSQTCAKMEKLTEMAKKRSLFDDQMAQVEELSNIIKQDITGLNKQIALLQEHSKNRSSVTKAGQGRGHSQLVVINLQSRLASVSKDFQSVLELRTENLKHQKSRRERFSNAKPIPSSLPPTLSAGNMGSVLLQEETSSSSSVAVDIDDIQRNRMQQVAFMEHDSYVQARSSTMENIESSISELGQIFRQLASLVSEQGEMITRIDSNVEETSMNVDAAHTELVKYFHSISQNRWLMIKIFGVLIVFFIIFVLFMT